MTKFEARLAIAMQCGAEIIGHYHLHNTVRFLDGRKADECKAILDALDPGFTGEIYADNRLLIADPNPYEEGTQ